MSEGDLAQGTQECNLLQLIFPCERKRCGSRNFCSKFSARLHFIPRHPIHRRATHALLLLLLLLLRPRDDLPSVSPAVGLGPSQGPVGARGDL